MNYGLIDPLFCSVILVMDKSTPSAPSRSSMSMSFVFVVVFARSSKKAFSLSVVISILSSSGMSWPTFSCKCVFADP